MLRVRRYRAVTSAYYRGALGAMVVYDVTRRATFDHVPRWVEELRAHADGSTVVSLVGNKADLAPAHRQREVPTDEAAQFAEEQGLFFSEASALTGDNVERAFLALLEEVFAVVSRRALQLDEARRTRHGAGGDGDEVLSLKGTTVDLHDPIMETSAMKKIPSSQCACS